jgi:two-component system copper resistance phosphate regulon response regulator CusR
MNKKSILIVDDEFEICVLLSAFLKGKGYHAVYANSLSEGRELLDKHSPFITFLDINLPDGLGFELISKIKSNPRAKVIIISAREGIEEKTRSQELLVDDYITKPFTRNEILNSIEKISQT